MTRPQTLLVDDVPLDIKQNHVEHLLEILARVRWNKSSHAMCRGHVCHFPAGVLGVLDMFLLAHFSLFHAREKLRARLRPLHFMHSLREKQTPVAVLTHVSSGHSDFVGNPHLCVTPIVFSISLQCSTCCISLKLPSTHHPSNVHVGSRCVLKERHRTARVSSNMIAERGWISALTRGEASGQRLVTTQVQQTHEHKPKQEQE